MKIHEVTVRWTWQDGRIWASCSDGRSIPTWSAAPQFACFTDLLNVAPALGQLLLATWLDPL